MAEETNNIIETPLGGIVKYNGRLLKCVRSNNPASCRGCFFKENSKCKHIAGYCESIYRSDNIDVMFIEIPDTSFDFFDLMADEMEKQANEHAEYVSPGSDGMERYMAKMSFMNGWMSAINCLNSKNHGK